MGGSRGGERGQGRARGGRGAREGRQAARGWGGVRGVRGEYRVIVRSRTLFFLHVFGARDPFVVR